eukprot:3327798-Prymnesium_polylepis.1
MRRRRWPRLRWSARLPAEPRRRLREQRQQPLWRVRVLQHDLAQPGELLVEAHRDARRGTEPRQPTAVQLQQLSQPHALEQRPQRDKLASAGKLQPAAEHRGRAERDGEARIDRLSRRPARHHR